MYNLQQIKNTMHILETPFTEYVSDYMRMFIQTLSNEQLNSEYLNSIVNDMEKYKYNFVEKYYKLNKKDFSIIKYSLQYVFINTYAKNKKINPYKHFIDILNTDLSKKLAKYINKTDFLFLSAAFIFLCNDIDCEDDIAHIRSIETFNAAEMREYINIFNKNETIII